MVKKIIKILIALVIFVVLVDLLVEETSQASLDTCNEDCAFYDADDIAWFDSDEDYDEDDSFLKDEDKREVKLSKNTEKVFDKITDLETFVNTVSKSTTETWTKIFASFGKQYRAPKFVYYDTAVETPCGEGEAESGPFYCPTNETVYIDSNFFNSMGEIGIKGNFAYGYVIAHEVGHHIQNLTGDNAKYGEIEYRLNERGKTKKANLVSVQSELQADFYAGIWAHNVAAEYENLSEDDILNAIDAASAVGDDMLGTDSPENFGHGSAEMRYKWFTRGMVSGDVKNGNTYRYRSLRLLQNVDDLTGE